MAMHAAFPDPATFEADGPIRCLNCGEPVIEEIYAGGWWHARRDPHPFNPYVYPDGAKALDRGCVECAQPADAPLHTTKI